MKPSRKNLFKITAITAAITLSSLNANAALYNRGNGMIYDSTQNITWMQDANYAKTTGYSWSGTLDWYQATNWADNLVYGGFSDWRLPSAGLNGTNYFCWNVSCPGKYDGTDDLSFNNTRSELGHLFLELGNKAYYNTSGLTQTDYGWMNSAFVDAGTGQSASFLNVSQYGYWEAEATPFGDASWMYDTYYGAQVFDGVGDYYMVWAVRNGDVLPVNEVPVPAAVWLMGTGLIGLAGVARRKK